MTLKFTDFSASFEIPYYSSFIKWTSDSLVPVIIMFNTNDLPLMLFQLIDTFARLDVPDPSCTVQRRCAQVGTIWVEFDWGDLTRMSTQMLQHFAFYVPEPNCRIKRTCRYEILLWKMTEIKTKNCISMTLQSTYELARIWVPYLASAIIAGSGKIVTILAKSTLSQRLFMCLQM